MGELGALFNPGMRHELEERQAKAARREEEGNARDGDLRIDLESGVAVINISGGDGDEHDAHQSDSAAAAGSDTTGPDTTGPDSTGSDTATSNSPTSDTGSDSTTSDGATSDSTGSDPGTAASHGTAAERAPAAVADAATSTKPEQALRPRGKRGMSAANR